MFVVALYKHVYCTVYLLCLKQSDLYTVICTWGGISEGFSVALAFIQLTAADENGLQNLTNSASELN